MSDRSTAALVKHIRAAAGPRERPDADLLADVAASRDPTAFAALVRRHEPLVRSACRPLLRDEADVDDAVQATFVVLYRRARSVRNGRALAGWLFRVARRAALQVHKASERRRRCEAKSRGTQPTPPDLSWPEACAILHEELDRLPDSYRLPLILCYLEGRSRDEAARELGWSLNTLRGRLERARVQLRQRVERRGVALSAGLLAGLAAANASSQAAQQLLEASLKPSPAVAAVAAAIAPHGLGAAWKAAAVLLLAAAVLAAVVGGNAGDPVAAGQPAPPAPAVPRDEAKPAEAVAVAGRVLGPDGKPVAGAKLTIVEAAGSRPAPQAAAEADGSFQFTLPPDPGFRYRYLLATAPQLGCDWVKLPTYQSAKPYTLRLPDDVPIAGRLLDLEGKPVAGAAVRLESIDTASSGHLDEFLKAFGTKADHEQSVNLLDKRLLEGDPLAQIFHATSDADGRFTLRGIGRDRVPGFIVRAKSHAQQAVRVVTRPGFDEKSDQAWQRFHVVGPNFTLTMPPGRAASGVVRDAVTKQPQADVRVAVLFRDEATFLRQWHSIETKTDAAGRYSLSGLAGGKPGAILFDSAPGRGYLHYYAALETGYGPIVLDGALQRGVIVEGRLTDKDTGRPVRAFVFHRPLEGNELVGKTPGYEWLEFGAWADDDTARTDADGHFRLTALPGRGLLHIQAQDLNPTAYPPTRLDPKDKDRIYGEVFPNSKFIVFKTIGRGGHYGPESLTAYRVIDPEPGDATLTVDATLWAGYSRKVRVLDPDGQPLEGADATGVTPHDGFAPVGPDAMVRALDPQQPRTLLFRHQARLLFALVTLKGTEPEPVDVRLQPTATVTGRLVDESGKPLTGVYTVEPSYQEHPIGTLLNTERLFAKPQSALKTDAAGRFRLEGLPAGITMHLLAHGPQKKDYSYTKTTFKLEAGKVKDLGDWRRE